MFNLYFNIGMFYSLIGFVTAFCAVFIFRKRVLGKFWGALIVGIFGAFLGGILEYLMADIIDFLRNINGMVNIFPPLIVSTILVFIMTRVSDRR